jgi:hypothetical protein
MLTVIRRLALVFATLALGLAIAAWAGVRAIATRVLAERVGPVEQALIFDWETHADLLERQLNQASPWATASEHTPTELGCQLKWTGHPLALSHHAARCKNTLLTPEQLADLEGAARDFDVSWLAAFRGHDDFATSEGTPVEFFELDPAMGSQATDFPSVDAAYAQAVARLRLAQGQRQHTLEGAAEDVTAFARALLHRPTLSEQLAGVMVLERLADQAPALAPSVDVIGALKDSRLALALLWHPWVPHAQRTRFLPKLSPSSKCAAVMELLPMLELGPPLAEVAPDFIIELDAWRGKGCEVPAVARALELRRRMPDDAWPRAFRASGVLNTDDPKALGPALALQAMKVNALARKAAVESVLTVMTVKPFLNTSSSTTK